MSQTITGLTVENVKRILAVSITPDGNAVVIGGENAQGKTSILDAIEMAIAGTKSIPEKPIRDGASRARVVLETQELTIERTFTGTGSQLVVKNKNAGNAKIASPQTLLDTLTSRISFDPLAFTRMKDDEQSEQIRRLVGIDFTKLDEEFASKYAERTGVNRDVKNQQMKCDGLQRFTDAPKELVIADAISDRLIAATATNTENTRKRDSLCALNDAISDREDEKARACSEVARIQAELERAQAAFNAAGERVSAAIKERDARFTECEALVDVDLAPIQEELRNVEATNAKFRANVTWQEEQDRLMKLSKQSKDLTDRLEKIETEKLETLAKAKFPIEGLNFDKDGGVTFQGMPFAQASAAEQLRVSVAMGFAMQPDLKIALIRDGSLLDKKSLAMVLKIAEECSGQVWIEKVGDGDECQVIIEDGNVKEDRTQANAARRKTDADKPGKAK